MRFDLRRRLRLRHPPGCLDLEVVNESEVPFVAEVECLADDAPVAEVGRSNTEGAGEVGRQVGLRLLDGQPEVRDAKGHCGMRNRESE